MSAAEAGKVDGHQGLHRAILGALLARGLTRTASSLRREAGLGDVEPIPPSQLGLYLAPDALPPEARQALRKSTDSINKRGTHGKAFAEKLDQAAAQRAKVQALLDKVKLLRNGSGGSEKEKSHKEQELEVLQQTLEMRSAVGADLEKALKAAKEEVGKLRSVTAEQHPTQSQTYQEKVSDILRDWDTNVGATVQAAHAFMKADGDDDGRITWNSGEILDFVKGVFQHFGIDAPPWPQPFWYSLYRKTDYDHSYALDQNEAFSFAKQCFESAANWTGQGTRQNVRIITGPRGETKVEYEYHHH